VRQQAQQYGLSFQQRPPYYVLETDRLSYADLRRLRRELKQAANLPPDVVEGMPEPRRNALVQRDPKFAGGVYNYVDQLWLLAPEPMPVNDYAKRLAGQVDVVMKAKDMATYSPMLATAIKDNPSTVFDVYLYCETETPSAHALLQWREALPFQPGYLDRVAVYQANNPEQGHTRVNPRCFLLLPWTSIVEPAAFDNIAEVIWRFELAEGDAVPLKAWYGAGGIGVCLRFLPDCTENYHSQVIEELEQWHRETGRFVWFT
jgi:Protein of unknown function (DUF4080)